MPKKAKLKLGIRFSGSSSEHPARAESKTEHPLPLKSSPGLPDASRQGSPDTCQPHQTEFVSADANRVFPVITG